MAATALLKSSFNYPQSAPFFATPTTLNFSINHVQVPWKLADLFLLRIGLIAVQGF